MEVVNVLTLFAGIQSSVKASIVAVFVIMPLVQDLMVIEIVAVALLAMLPRLTVTMPLFSAKAPCEVLAVIKETPAGNVSVNTELPAVDGPLLVTLNV